jgi:hypothetical protein
MNAKGVVTAIIAAGVRHGTDGHGKDGLDGRMFMLARTDPKGFGTLLARALRLKMKAKPDECDRTRGKKYLTEEEAEAELREAGIPVEVLQFLPCYDLRDLPAEPPESAGPNGTRDMTEAVINAAVRHGNDGHGRDGLMGYLLLLQDTEPKTFSMLMDVAQRWQATSRSDEPNERMPTEEELRAARVALDAVRKAKFGEFERHYGENPYPSPEDEDYPTESDDPISSTRIAP